VLVGVVVSAAPHPDGDTLYVEQIDVGEKVPRTIVSGIREHVPLDQFVGARVLVMCNLKEKPLRGVNSNGMICCASITEGEKKTVRLLEISSTAKRGERVQWAGEPEGVLADETPIAAKKLTKLLGGLRTDAQGVVVFGEEGFKAHAGGQPITCKAIVNGVVG
jgi:aminoacyl tRNA synthase complex-interacting multifunctional protein 1